MSERCNGAMMYAPFLGTFLLPCTFPGKSKSLKPTATTRHTA